jgi:hypothetical protein
MRCCGFAAPRDGAAEPKLGDDPPISCQGTHLRLDCASASETATNTAIAANTPLRHIKNAPPFLRNEHGRSDLRRGYRQRGQKTIAALGYGYSSGSPKFHPKCQFLLPVRNECHVPSAPMVNRHPVYRLPAFITCASAGDIKRSNSTSSRTVS